MRLFKVLWLCYFLVPARAYDPKKFGIKRSIMSKENRFFVNKIISRYAAIKHGFVVLFINNIHPDYGDYVARAVSKLNSSGFIMNFHKDRDATLTVGEKHVKIAVVDPRADLSHVHHIFGRIKEARSKIIVICTKPPPDFLLNTILATYRKKQCLEAIVAYQKFSKINVFTVNPFLPDQKSFTNLTSTDDFFYNKLRDMQGYKINALFAYEDKTKANSITTGSETIYSGKDYDALYSIFKHMNASLNIINVKDVLLRNEVNPWINSNRHVNRLAIKQRIIENYNISIVVHSQPFVIDDEITENTYPHTQDDGCILILKEGELSLHNQLIQVLSRAAWTFYFFACSGIMMLAFVVGRFTGVKIYTCIRILVETVRFTYQNNFGNHPRPSLYNIILFGWICFCFYINMFFQTQFTSILTKKSFAKDIDTIQEFYDSGREAYAFSNQIEEINKIYNGTNFSDFASRLIPFPEHMTLWEINRDAIYSISAKEGALRPFVINHDRAEFVSRARKCRKNGRAIFHVMRESIIPSYQCFQIRHGSPFLPTVDRYLRYLQESGIMRFWERMTIYRAENEGLLVPSESYEETSQSPRILDLKRSYMLFILLPIGYAMAFVAFVIEIIYKCVQDVRQKRQKVNRNTVKFYKVSNNQIQ